jgi:FixJ family two-component response regulator
MQPQRLTIAVVDDDDTVRDSLRALLETYQYTVVDFADGDSFLSRDRGIPLRCVLLDVHMPGKGGFEVLKALREGGDMTPVILITGRSDRLLEAKARLEASVAILDKPVAQARLFAAIDTALAGRL